MKFTKMQGCGNDYIYVNCLEKDLDNPGEISIKVSDRHFGIGADGLILIKKSDRADFFMEMYNADGSQGEMCGNATRCVAKYVYENGITDKKEISLDTLGGIKYLKLEVTNNKVESVRVNMGSPILLPKDIPVDFDGDRVVNEPVIIDDKEYRITCVSMGNPHAVVFMDEINHLKLEEIGPLFENYEKFPNRINTEFVKVIDREHIKMRVWERGSGETLACGTGTCASVMACILNGFTENSVEVELLGGKLFIEYNEKEDKLYMTGPAETVFEGEIDI